MRICHLLDQFRADYDLMLIDTQGARSVLLEMAVLAADRVLSPITPEMLAAREFRRGTLRLLEDLRPFQRLGLATPPLSIVLNRADTVSIDARLIMSFRYAPGQRLKCQRRCVCRTALEGYSIILCVRAA